MILTGIILEVALIQGPIPRAQIALLPDGGGAAVRFLLPGSNGAPPLAVWGVPEVAPGERWQVELVEAPGGWVPRGLGAGMRRLDGGGLRYATSGLKQDSASFPLTFYLHEAGPPGASLGAAESAAEAAIAQWDGVRCASLEVAYGGLTDAAPADDGIDTLSWISEGWEWGPEVIGLPMVWYDDDDPDDELPGTWAGVDLVFNGVDYAWTDGPGDKLQEPSLLNLRTVIAHELGHPTAGLAHTDVVAATMFFPYIGGEWMGTLAGDDRRGVCEVYPNGEHECDVDADCDGIDESERYCLEISGVRICEEVRDPFGAPCSRLDFNCASICAFTDDEAGDGYCSEPCASDADCPEGSACGEEPIAQALYGASGVCLLTEIGDSGDLGAAPDACACAAGGSAGGAWLFASLLGIARRRRA